MLGVYGFTGLAQAQYMGKLQKKIKNVVSRGLQGPFLI